MAAVGENTMPARAHTNSYFEHKYLFASFAKVFLGKRMMYLIHRRLDMWFCRKVKVDLWL